MNDFKPGLEGVVAVETEIAEPDREGGALRYRGVDIEELVGRYPYENVWGLLVDDDLELEDARPRAVRAEGLTGNAPADLQSEIAHLAGEWKLQKLVDIDDEQARDDLGRLSAQMMWIVARSAALRGRTRGSTDDVVAQGETAAEKFLLRWRGEANPDHVKAIDTYWICTAEHGLNASTFTARVVASTGADCGAAMSAAVGALSGPLHGGAPARVLPMLDEVAATGDPEGYVKNLLDQHGRIMGFGHRVYRAEDPRSRILKRTAQEVGSPRIEVAEALEEAALAALHERKPDYVIATNVEFYSAVRPRRGRGAAGPDAGDVRVLARGRLVGAHPRGEAHRAAVQAQRDRTSGPARGRCPLSELATAGCARRIRSPGTARSRSSPVSERAGRTSSRPRSGRRTTASAPSRTARSGSSATGRRPSSCAAGSRTRARRAAARR